MYSKVVSERNKLQKKNRIDSVKKKFDLWWGNFNTK